MKTGRACLVSMIVIGPAAFVQSALSGEEPQPEGQQTPMPAEQQAAMAEYMKIAMPGEQHKHLDILAGKWKTKSRIYMGGPGSTPMETEGTAEAKWVLDGRFVLIEHDGTMMGMPHKGLWLIGHDNFRKLFTASYASSMGTELLSMSGARHPETGVITFYGQMDEPMLKVVGRMVKYVIRPSDKDSWTFEMIDLHAGDDYKVVEVTYTPTE